MWTVLLLAMGLMAIAFLLLGVRIFFVNGGKFPSSSVGKNAALRKYGISCAKHEEIAQYRKMLKKKINPKELRVVVE